MWKRCDFIKVHYQLLIVFKMGHDDFIYLKTLCYTKRRPAIKGLDGTRCLFMPETKRSRGYKMCFYNMKFEGKITCFNSGLIYEGEAENIIPK